MEGKRMGVPEIAALLSRMLAPQKGERLLFLTDYSDRMTASRAWRDEMLSRWHKSACVLAEKEGFSVLPAVKYRETGKPNAPLPKTAAAQGGGHVSDLPELVASANIVIAMTEYSATAPLHEIAKRTGRLRLVSMPGVTPDMEGAMAADYAGIAERGRRLLAVLENAAGFEITFDGAGVPRGTRLFVDTRASGWIVDAADCRKPGTFINFPSGELFTPPYEGVSGEGRRQLGDSRTMGIWPVVSHKDGKVAFLKVEKNRIVKVQGECEAAEAIIADIASDESNANVAEIAFGLNDRARGGAEVPVLEREKAGFHLAYGRNDHFGTPLSMAGKVSSSVHVDFVYTRETSITATVYAVYPNGKKLLIVERGKMVAV
jgi:leucyl aminopeptidase (aminopeptidase T)